MRDSQLGDSSLSFFAGKATPGSYRLVLSVRARRFGYREWEAELGAKRFAQLRTLLEELNALA